MTPDELRDENRHCMEMLELGALEALARVHASGLPASPVSACAREFGLSKHITMLMLQLIMKKEWVSYQDEPGKPRGFMVAPAGRDMLQMMEDLREL